jgi:hypothetical protein
VLAASDLPTQPRASRHAFCHQNTEEKECRYGDYQPTSKHRNPSGAVGELVYAESANGCVVIRRKQPFARFTKTIRGPSAASKVPNEITPEHDCAHCAHEPQNAQVVANQCGRFEVHGQNC